MDQILRNRDAHKICIHTHPQVEICTHMHTDIKTERLNRQSLQVRARVGKEVVKLKKKDITRMHTLLSAS